MASATPEELRQMRAAAAAANNTEDVKAIDAELARVVPIDEMTPLREAYADRRHAIEAGAPKELIDAIDAHIHGFTGLMKQADTAKAVEELGPTGRFLAGAGAGLTNVVQHAKDLAHEVATAGGQETGWDAFRGNQMGLGQYQLPVSAPAEGEAEYQAQRRAERAQALEGSDVLRQSLSGELGHLTGEAAGTTPIALATGGAGPVLGGALAGAGTGALLSEPGQRLPGAALGGTAGGALGFLGKLGGAAIEGPVQPSEAAQKLQGLGLKGITTGQAAPRSAIAHFEQAAESTPLGASVKAAREELPLNLEHRIIQEAAPPGFTPTLGRDASVPERLQELRGAYNQRYGELLDKTPVPVNHITKDVYLRAAKPTGRVLTPADKAASEDFVRQELSKLQDDGSLETLANIRSSIRDKIRSLDRVNPELANHFRDVRDALTEHIDMAMSPYPEKRAALRALDQSYSKFKTVLGAASQDPAGAVTITPDRLSRSILSGTTRDRFAMGGGGDLRELARAGKQVLSPPRPTTGALTGILHAIPFAGPWATGVAGYASSHFPAAMLGQTTPQRILQRTLMQPVVSGAVGQAARTGAADFLLPLEESAPDYLTPEPVSMLPQTLKKRKK